MIYAYWHRWWWETCVAPAAWACGQVLRVVKPALAGQPEERED